LLEIGNQRRVQESLNESGTRLAADVIKNALFTHLILLVARAHGGKDVWAGDRHAGMAFEQLNRFPKIAEEMQSPTDVAEARRLWDKCRGDHRREGFLHYRDKYLAHLGEAGQDPPKYDDVFGFARATASALEKLAHGTGVIGVSHRSQLQARKASAEKFWKRTKT
jgi:hypothetical protein